MNTFWSLYYISTMLAPLLRMGIHVNNNKRSILWQLKLLIFVLIEKGKFSEQLIENFVLNLPANLGTIYLDALYHRSFIELTWPQRHPLIIPKFPASLSSFLLWNKSVDRFSVDTGMSLQSNPETLSPPSHYNSQAQLERRTWLTDVQYFHWLLLSAFPISN